MSKHTIQVIQVGEILAHDNADSLERTMVYGWQCCLRKGQFKQGDLAVFIPPDYLVEVARPEFAFLAPRAKNGLARITAMRMRGALSYGLIIPCPEGATVGECVMARLGITRYEPPDKVGMSGDCVSPPLGLNVKFDVENLERYPAQLVAGEEVIATEKVHGANARFMLEDGKLFCGSRTQWYAEDSNAVWALAARKTPGIRNWCAAHPGACLYGEVYGPVQELTYGTAGQVKFAAFAALCQTGYMGQDALFESCDAHGVPHMPVVYRGPFDLEKLRALAEQDSVLALPAKQLSEGLVIVPKHERTHPDIGRVCLKLVSFRYLTK